MTHPTVAETPAAIIAVARALDEHPQLRDLTAGYQKTIGAEAVKALLALEWMGPAGTALVGAALDKASDEIDRLRAAIAALQPEPETEAIHRWFELTYSNYLVLPRSLMQSMPDEWQTRAVKVFEELREAFANLDHPQYNVETGTWFEPNDLTDAQEKALGITYEPNANEDEPGTWHDRFGDELDANRACVFVPGPDPIPHYNRGRTRVPLAPSA